MTMRRRVAISVGVGLIFSLIGSLCLGVVNGHLNVFPSIMQYLVLTYLLPCFGAAESEVGTAQDYYGWCYG